MKNKKLSPFSREFWVQRGYSEKEADEKRNSFRPIRKEYWMKLGYSEEESIEKALKTKDNNNKKGAKSAASRPKEKIKLNSPRCIEYWLNKGYNEEEAKLERKKYQSFNKLEKWIERHGEELGKKLWKERQVNWINTLSKKSNEEKIRINKEKNSISYERFIDRGMTKEEIVQELKQTRNMDLTIDREEFISKIKKDINDNPSLKYQTPLNFSKNYQKIQYKLLEIKNPSKFVKPFLESNKLFKEWRGKSYGNRLYVDEGLLRSSLEIEFYKICKKLNILFMLDKNYPNSNFRYDFFLPKINKYIEISPEYGKKFNTKYTEKINQKKKIFNCEILTNMNDINSFFKEHFKNED